MPFCRVRFLEPYTLFGCWDRSCAQSTLKSLSKVKVFWAKTLLTTRQESFLQLISSSMILLRIVWSPRHFQKLRQFPMLPLAIGKKRYLWYQKRREKWASTLLPVSVCFAVQFDRKFSWNCFLLPESKSPNKGANQRIIRPVISCNCRTQAETTK